MLYEPIYMRCKEQSRETEWLLGAGREGNRGLLFNEEFWRLGKQGTLNNG